MRISCPWCGTRDVEEFVFGGDASAKRPSLSDTDSETWLSFLYERKNPKGSHLEYWQHERGCRHWLVMERDTVTHDIIAIQFADEVEP